MSPKNPAKYWHFSHFLITEICKNKLPEIATFFALNVYLKIPQKQNFIKNKIHQKQNSSKTKLPTRLSEWGEFYRVILYI